MKTAAETYERSQNFVQAAWMWGWIGSCHEGLKDDTVAAEHYQEALRRFRELNFDEGVAVESEVLGKTLKRLNKFQEGLPHFTTAADAYERMQNPVQAAWMFDWIGSCHESLNDTPSATRAYEEGLRRFQELKMADGIAELTKHIATALWADVQRLDKEGKVKEAVAAGERALAADRKRLAGQSPDLSNSLEWLAQRYERLDDFDLARQSRQEFLDTKTRLVGKDHWQITDARLALANVDLLERLNSEQRSSLRTAASKDAETVRLAQEGQHSSALRAGQEAVEIHRAILGEKHPVYANSLFNVAFVYRSLSEYARAESLLLQSLEIRRESFGESHPAYAMSLNNLGSLYGAMGDWARGEPFLRQALAIRKEALGESDPLYAASLQNLGATYRALNDFKAAEKLYQQALDIRKRVVGESHPDYAKSLTYLGDLYLVMADFSKSGPLFSQALEIKRQALGETHPDFAEGLFELGRQYHATGDYVQAESLFRKSLEIRKKVLGEGHRDYASSLSSLASLQQAMGKHAEAELLLKQALEIRKKVLGEAHLDYAVTLNELAQHYQSIGEYSKAEPLFWQALETRKKALGETSPEYATSLNSLAAICQEMADFERAEKFYQQALEIRKKSVGEAHPQFGASLNNLAQLYRVKGDYTRAEPLFRQAADVWKKGLGEAHPNYGMSLNNLALLYLVMGDNARAEPLFAQAAEIWKKTLGEAHPLYAASLNNLSVLYQAMGDFTRAEPVCRQAAEVWKRSLGDTHPTYATGLDNLALLLKAKGDFAGAEALCNQAVEIRKKALGEGHPSYAESLNTLVVLYHAMGDYERAEPVCRQAADIFKRALGETHPSYALSLNNLAALYRAMGDEARAETLLRHALKISRKNLDLAAVVQSERQQMAMLSRVRFQLDSLIALAAKSPTLGPAAYEEVLIWKGLVSGRQQQMHSALAGNPNLAPLFEELRSVATKLATLSVAAPASDQLAQWQAKISELSRQKEALEARLAKASHEYRQARAPITAVDIKSALPEGAAFVDLLEFWHSEPKPKAHGAGMIFERRLAAFVVLSSKLNRRAGMPATEVAVRFVDLGAVQPVKEAIEKWRKDLGKGNGAEEAGRVLRQRIWEPLEQVWAGGGQSPLYVLLSPDGELGKLPFPVLPGKTPGSYLLEEYTLAVVPAAEAIVAGAKQGVIPPATTPANLRNMLVLADVNYDSRTAPAAVKPKAQFSWRAARDDSDELFPALAGTRGELATIQKLYRDSFGTAGLTTLESAGASQDAFIREAPEHRYLHVATHGYFAAERFKSALGRSTQNQPTVSAVATQPSLAPGEPGATVGAQLISNQTLAGYHPGLLSGLALAGANRPTEDDDGILTAEEVGTLNLTSTALVVLSACETGLGEVAGGEGLLGLQRAFQTAGAKTVIASLWKVDDVATRDLMERFYDNLWNKNMGKLDALREAQLWMLKERGPRGLTRIEADGEVERLKRLPPYYWAAWVLSGDWR